MGGGKGSTPDPPDYTPLAQASEKSAQIAAEVSREQLAWAKDQYAQNKQISDKLIDQAMRISADEAAAGKADRTRYQEKFQPLEDDLTREFHEYNTEAKIGQEAGRASAAVATQFDIARQAAVADLESYGVDPSQTRSAALDLGTRIAQGAATAGAANLARENVLNTRRALRSEAINIGRGYGSQIAGAYGTALAAGNQGVNAGLATTASGASTMGTATQWAGVQQQGLGNWGNALNSQGAQANAIRQQQSQSSAGMAQGIGSIIGAVAGSVIAPGVGTMLGGALGGAIGGAAGGAFKEGGRVAARAPAPAIAGPTQSGQPAMAVTPQMSPSRGAATDDVAIRASEGEVVVPEDVARWYGEKFFHDMAIKARKAQGEANPRGLGPPGGRPSAAPAIPMGA